METIDKEKLKKLQREEDQLVLIEVLNPDEYKKFHISGAVNVPMDEEFEARVQQAVPEKDIPVVVYCQNTQCPVSEEAARKLDSLGYSQVYDYAGGKEDWQEAGEPVAAGEQSG